jgi:hypothetical protein
MSPRPLDTTPDAWSAHSTIVAGLSGEARVLAALELSEAVRSIRLAGIRARNPALDAAGALRELIRLDYGVDLPVP